MTEGARRGGDDVEGKDERARGATGWDRWAPRLVVAVAAIACLADQPPRWTLEATAPKAPAAAPGKALRVTVEASREPTLQVAGGTLTTWEDVATPRTSWPGKADLFVDGGHAFDGAHIGDRCTSGGGMCSDCDPPPGAYVRVVGVTEVDVWSTSVSTTVAAGASPRIDLEIETTREPLVISVPSSDGSCGTSFASSSPLSAPSGPIATPGARRIIVSCWERGAATITATIRGACAAGPCAPPAVESISIARAVRVP